jgi:O-6-methylguanine DNA methyltransferase
MSRLGWLTATFGRRGRLMGLAFIHQSASEDTVVTLSHPSAERCLECLKQQLDGYWKRSCRTFNIPLLLAGNALQQRVWEELLTIRFGQCLDLPSLALRVGAPGSLLAVAEAIRDNPIALLVPSHRVFGWESLATPGSAKEWLSELRRLEDLVPGENTCLSFGKHVSTPEEWARAKALAPSALMVPES